jgi:tRNA(fMet)-specific endonuclease VapC
MTTRILDSTLLIDLLSGDPHASKKVGELQESGDLLRTASPCVAEIVRGVRFANPKQREAAEGLLSQLEVLPVDERAARRAGDISAETAHRGCAVGLVDCLIAGVALMEEATVVTRDTDFARVPGLTIETY